MHYDYVPHPKRQPLRWPDGKRHAVIVTLNLEYWDMLKDTTEPYYAGGPPAIPDPVPGNILDVPNFSWREYGQRVGIWRLMEAFDGVGVPASCTVNAKVGLERREMVDAVLERGWELVAHNYEQGDLLTNYQFDKDQEEALIKAALKVFKDVTGRDSKGWLSSSLRSTPNTPDILADNGLIFLCDYMNDEQPYLIQTPSGPIVSIPYTVEINDFMIFSRRGMTTSEASQLFQEQLAAIALMVALHPFLATDHGK